MDAEEVLPTVAVADPTDEGAVQGVRTDTDESANKGAYWDQKEGKVSGAAICPSIGAGAEVDDP